MNKRPGHVAVTTEVAVCSFCGRPRTLRREEHQLGTLVRTIITCESCHRTLSSTIGVAGAAPAEPEPFAPEPAPTPKAAPAAKTVPAKPAVPQEQSTIPKKVTVATKTAAAGRTTAAKPPAAKKKR